MDAGSRTAHVAGPIGHTDTLVAGRGRPAEPLRASAKAQKMGVADDAACNSIPTGLPASPLADSRAFDGGNYIANCKIAKLHNEMSFILSTG